MSYHTKVVVNMQPLFLQVGIQELVLLHAACDDWYAARHTVVRKGLAEIGRRAHGATNEFIRDSRSAGQSVPRKNKWNYTLASSSFFSQNL